MGKPLPVDLRERVVGAVDEGQSRRKEAERFGVSISSAIRSGPACGGGRARCSPSARGDKRSGRIEAHRPLILSLVAAKADITLAELRTALAERGIAVAISTLWRFFERHRITLKRRPGMLRRAAARTVAALERAIVEAIDTFTPTEWANYFAAAGYDAT